MTEILLKVALNREHTNKNPRKNMDPNFRDITVTRFCTSFYLRKFCMFVLHLKFINFVLNQFLIYIFFQTLQNFMYTMLKDNNPIAAKMSLVSQLLQ